MDWDIPCNFTLLVLWKGNVPAHIYTADGGKGYTLHVFILLVAERETQWMSIQLVL